MSRAASILAEVAAKHGITVKTLLDRDRRPHVAAARHEAMWRMRQLCDGALDSPWSLVAIGRHFRRDHTTVMYGVRAHERRMANLRMVA